LEKVRVLLMQGIVSLLALVLLLLLVRLLMVPRE
jgi:hypothetical protein